MEEAYLHDLEGSTEILLGPRHRVRPLQPARHASSLHGSTNRAAAAALRVSGAVGAALSRPRTVGAAESSALASFAAPLAVLTLVALFFPRAVAWPIAFIAGAFSLWLLQRALRLRAGGSGPDEVP